MVTTETCSFQRVSDQGCLLAKTLALAEVSLFVRQILACERRRSCRDADCCVIFGAGLLADLERRDSGERR